MSIESLGQLSRAEKLIVMEMLGEDLSRADGEAESPAWHAEELVATETRLTEGKEEIIDWDKAKATLRNKAA